MKTLQERIDPQYIKYQKKARVSSYAEPIARGCAMDIASACVENPGSSNITVADLPNCTNGTVSTPGGSVELDTPTSLNCNSDGTVSSNVTVTAQFKDTTLQDYKAKCTVSPEGIKCKVE